MRSVAEPPKPSHPARGAGVNDRVRGRRRERLALISAATLEFVRTSDWATLEALTQDEVPAVATWAQRRSRR
jgi:hypothetical protein